VKHFHEHLQDRHTPCNSNESFVNKLI